MILNSSMTGAVQHIYQRTSNDSFIFYDIDDYLVFFTVFSSFAIKNKMTILGLCLMFDHIHVLVATDDVIKLRLFVMEYSSMFVKEYNKASFRSGPLFEKGFGYAPKLGEKRIRTAIAYVYNNPVEKNLCKRAIENRWNFLSYAQSNNPFSKKITLRTAKTAFRKAISIVNYNYKKCSPLTYPLLKNLMWGLNITEREQLTDYIISLYNPIDYNKSAAFFGSIDKMILAIDYNTGSEYQIKEAFTPYSDAIFRKMIDTVHRIYPDESVKYIFQLTEEEKYNLKKILIRETGASGKQIAKLFRLTGIGT